MKGNYLTASDGQIFLLLSSPIEMQIRLQSTP